MPFSAGGVPQRYMENAPSNNWKSADDNYGATHTVLTERPTSSHRHLSLIAVSDSARGAHEPGTAQRVRGRSEGFALDLKIRRENIRALAM